MTRNATSGDFIMAVATGRHPAFREQFEISSRNFVCKLKWPFVMILNDVIRHFIKCKMVAVVILEIKKTTSSLKTS